MAIHVHLAHLILAIIAGIGSVVTKCATALPLSAR